MAWQTLYQSLQRKAVASETSKREKEKPFFLISIRFQEMTWSLEIDMTQDVGAVDAGGHESVVVFSCLLWLVIHCASIV